MSILHRYLLRQFLQIFAICFCSLYGLFVVIDAFANLDEFRNYGDEHGGTLAVVAQYYGYRVLPFFDTTSAIVTLIAAMFTLALFQRHNELTALLAAGVRKWRIIQPIIAAAVVIALLGAANRELFVPSVSNRLSHDVHDLSGDRARDLTPKPDNTTDIVIGGKQTIAKSRQIREASFLLPAALEASFNKIEATDAFYRPPQAGRPGGYLLKGVTQPKDLPKRHSLELAGRPVVLTPRDDPWLAADECFVASEVTFEQLAGSENWRQISSTRELIRALNNPSLGLGAEVAVTIHGRLIQPLLDVTLLFLGLPLILRRGNPNVFVAIGLCLVVVIGFTVVEMATQYLGSNYLIPSWLGGTAMGAWLPLIAFVPVAMGMSEPLRE